MEESKVFSFLFFSVFIKRKGVEPLFFDNACTAIIPLSCLIYLHHFCVSWMFISEQGGKKTKKKNFLVFWMESTDDLCSIFCCIIFNSMNVVSEKEEEKILGFLDRIDRRSFLNLHYTTSCIYCSFYPISPHLIVSGASIKNLRSKC